MLQSCASVYVLHAYMCIGMVSTTYCVYGDVLIAMATSMQVTPGDVLDYLLTLTPTEETLAYGHGRGQLRRLTFLLDYTQAWLAPLPLYQCLNAVCPGVLY